MTGHGRRRFLQLGVGGAAAGIMGSAAAGGSQRRDHGRGRPGGQAARGQDADAQARAHRASRCRCSGSAASTSGWRRRADRRRASSAPPSITASPSWTTAGTTTRARATRWMGKALRDGYRKRVFLMTKIDGRTRKAAAAQIDQSLQRAGDRRDRSDADPRGDPHDRTPSACSGRTARSRRWSRRRRRGRSASSASRGTRARTSTWRCWRRPRAHGFTFDAVQLPLNVMDAHYDSFERRVVPVLVEDATSACSG